MSVKNDLTWCHWPREPSVALATPRAIHWCLEQIWERLHLRARLFLLEGDALVLRDCVGEYRYCPEVGLRVHSESVVWKILKNGAPANLSESSHHKGRSHTLPEPVTIKAVVPLKVTDLACEEKETFGVLVVDAGNSPKPLHDRDFQFVVILGLLISEILQRSVLLEKIQVTQREKDRMAGEVSHVFRNRFTIIGGFARKLRRHLRNPILKKCAEIILFEVEKGEEALEAWRKTHKKERIEPE
jgi:hypothetical protein